MFDNDLVFDWIEISGFMSFPPNRPQRINLDTNRLTAIIGTVVDAIGPGERNGAGKTAILDAIQYLYFGRANRMPNKGFPNYVETGPMVVAGTARRSGIMFHVKRGENPSLLRLWEKPINDSRDLFTTEDGRYVFETTKSTKPETTKRIVELIGFDLKLVEVLLVNEPSDKSCYFLKTSEEQRDIQERVFGFTVFTEKAERLRELRKEETRNFTTKESAFIATRQANDRVLAEIAQLEEKAAKWAAERDHKAKFLTQQIKSYTGVDFEAQETVLQAIAETELEITEIEREINLVEQAVQQADARFKQWSVQRQTEMTALRQTITKLSEADAARDIATIKAREALRQELLGVTAKIADHQTALTMKLKILGQANTASQGIAAEIAKIEQQILELDAAICPTCKQHWADTKEHLAKCVDDLERLTGEYEQLQSQLEDARRDVSSVESALVTLQEMAQQTQQKSADLPATSFASIEEASAASTRAEELTRKLADLQQIVNPHTEALMQAEERLSALQDRVIECRHKRAVQAAAITTFATLPELIEARRYYAAVQTQFEQLQASENPYRETIDNLRTKALKQVDETEMRELKTRIDHMSMLITLLSDKDSPIRRAVLNEWLPELNMRVNRYLELLELPHRVKFETDMSATFLHFDKTLVFQNLSAGQRLRAWLATAWGLREIFELINFRINLFFVDEVLDKGMSPRGAEVSYHLLNGMVKEDKSVFLITHRSELTDIADHVLNVTLEGGLTTINAEHEAVRAYNVAHKQTSSYT